MNHGAPTVTAPSADAQRPNVECDPHAVPDALKERKQWVVWRYAVRDGEPTKVPFDAKSGREADSTNPSTWSTFAEVVHALGEGSTFAGIGYVFSADDPYCGIDLDECIIDGDLVSEAKAIVDTFRTYTEASPSGNGVKLIIAGKKPEWARCKSKHLSGFKETEVYDQKRFFTLTGRRLEGTPAAIANRQTELEDLCRRLWPEAVEVTAPAARAQTPVNLDDDALLERMFASKHGDAIRKLWSGDTSAHGGDDSAADLALCNHLAFWTGRDKGRMDQLFRRSGLYRAKWEREDYRNWTLDKAIEGCREVYEPGRSPRPRPDPDPPAVDSDGLIRLGERDPETGRLVLSTKRTQPTAEAFEREFHHHPAGRTLYNYAGMLMSWRGNRFVEIEDAAVKNQIQPWLHDALKYVFNRQTKTMELVDFDANPTTVNAALDTIRNQVYLPATTISPSWLGGGGDLPPANEILPCKSTLLHLPTQRRLVPTPRLFTVNALDYDPDPEATMPEAWFRFLDELFGEDDEAVNLLQEWLGYCLTGDTSQQKMLLLVGPRRSGKGTIGRVLTRLVGEGNVCGPTTSSLAGPFGLQPLIGKSVAIVSDARFSGENIQTVVERLLCISGEDALTVDRKHMVSVTMKLPTRFTFMTNELPRLSDASGALAGRFMILRLTRSFFGQEDKNLTPRLLQDLPGILNWAIEGWKRLRERGHFVQPKSVEDAIAELEDLASPVGAFVRDMCVVGPGHRVRVDDLYTAFKSWAEREGWNVIITKPTFGRDLIAAYATVSRRRNKPGGYFYDGIALKEVVL